MVKEQQTHYVSPKVKTVEIKAQAIICQSGGNTIDNLNLREDDSDNWN